MTFQYIQTDIRIYKGGHAIQSSTDNHKGNKSRHIDTHCDVCIPSTIPLVNTCMTYIRATDSSSGIALWNCNYFIYNSDYNNYLLLV
jgi:hypothetical protein